MVRDDCKDVLYGIAVTLCDRSYRIKFTHLGQVWWNVETCRLHLIVSLLFIVVASLMTNVQPLDA